MNQRKEIRLSGNYTVVIETQNKNNQQELFMACTSVDISSDGLQVTVSQELEPGHIYFVTVIPDNDDLDAAAAINRFHLVAENMWCKPLESQAGFRAGLKLLNSGDEHYLGWKQWVLQALLHSSND